MLQFLLLIVGIYLSLAFTLFFMTLMEKDKDFEKLREDMKKRDIKLDKILHLSYKIDTQLHIGPKEYYNKLCYKIDEKNTKTN